ncbi:MAG: hypothetical protein COB76_06160 [Alphaproteobacteria bacterium]|nr:MAG: hypothetical protein COB76_06160 [Alphaproteobacteria bacterium]
MCESQYTPRFSMSVYYKEIANPTLPLLVDQGTVRNSNGDTGAYCFVYEDNLGEQIYKPEDIIAPSWKSERVLEQIALPIINVLREFHSRDLVHGNIRVSNLYNGGQKNYTAVRLGDCLSLPASMAQPVVYEPVERSMTDPISRGQGTLSDDLYSLGIIIAMHLRSYDPLKGKTDNEIISAKVVGGSYSALVGANDRFTGAILELLRGLLIDDPKQRWNIDEVSAWLDGRRLSPKQPAKKKKATRSITLGSIAYYYPTTLAHNIVLHPQESVKLIESSELTHWVERTLADEEMLLRLENAIRGASEGGTGVGYWDRLLPRVSIALDPDAPIRYKGVSFLLDGLGNALAEAFVQKRGLSIFTNLFKENILSFWVGACADLNMDMAGYSSQIDKCQSFLKQSGMQYGIERCLYFLNNSIHCLSPIIESYYARTPGDYLLALDDFAKNSDSLPGRILDKHACCFLLSKEARIIEPFTFDLSSHEDFRHVLGTAQALAAIQKYHKDIPAPHVTQWLVKLMDPVVMRFHNIDRQKKVRSELAKKQSSGNIQDILDVVENPDRIRNDQLDFRRAFKEYHGLSNELKHLEHRLKNPKFNAEKSGREWAATISGIVSVLIILGFIMVQFGADRPF